MQFTYRMILSRLLIIGKRTLCWACDPYSASIRICAGPRVVQLSTSPYFSIRHAVLVEPYVVARDAETGRLRAQATADVRMCLVATT